MVFQGCVVEVPSVPYPPWKIKPFPAKVPRGCCIGRRPVEPCHGVEMMEVEVRDRFGLILRYRQSRAKAPRVGDPVTLETVWVR